MASIWKHLFKKKKLEAGESQPDEQLTSSLLTQLDANIERIRQASGHSPDIIIHPFVIGNSPGVKAGIVYIDGLVNKEMIENHVLLPLKHGSSAAALDDVSRITECITRHALGIGKIYRIHNLNDFMLCLHSGDTLILIDGSTEALRFSTEEVEHRAISEPSTQLSIRGPKDSFIESIGTNIALVRRRLKSPQLWMEALKIGKDTQTEVCMMYIKGKAKDELVANLKQQLNQIHIDGVLESRSIEEWIEDRTPSPFPTIYNTERPDNVVANLLEGRIAIFVDGTPFVLILPSTFFQFFQFVEDYYQSFDISVFIRVLRYASYIVALLGPSLYIAGITFHQEMVPTLLLISLAAQRESVPFPAFFEALMMEASFEVMREAGVRMPRPVGQAVSIVGALILGQAAVQAGLVSAAMVIVVSATGIASFTTPSFNLSTTARLLRFGFMVLAATFGLLGILIGSIVTISHMCSLRSLGVPYMAALAPYNTVKQETSVFQLPLKSFFSDLRRNKRSRMLKDEERNKS